MGIGKVIQSTSLSLSLLEEPLSRSMIACPVETAEGVVGDPSRSDRSALCRSTAVSMRAARFSLSDYWLVSDQPPGLLLEASP